MKFYLTKAQQRAAQGREPASKSARAAKSAPAEKAPKQAPASPVVSAGPMMAGAQASVAAPAAPSGPTAQAPMTRGNAAKPASVAPPKPAKVPKNAVAIGGVPHVDLLPLEVRAERRARQNVRRAWLGVVGVAVIAVIATGGATLVSMHAQEDLATSQGETSSLSAEQAKYAKVKVVENQTTLIDAARQVGGGTDIDWNAYLQKLQATLPADTTIKSVSVDSASATTAYTQSSAALQGVRIGTVTVTVESPTLPSVPKLLNGLVTLPGYVDATPGTVNASDGVYTANIVMHINQDAYSGLYTKKGK
ncbi:hypothetical protein EDF46_2846 [Frondihabitans sp. PhB188]|uniref:hypothetical protein n=1 Tax=Frondihabitans sp. PhB188 TaxID=2485200 RepID=UPI000F4A0EFA|nr:hypothetical protein [Frondihabitans sp. PhB188]ROQ37390.1 hypothetical protein EDF46_2846 [Frondihabitans sp. PhB188]